MSPIDHDCTPQERNVLLDRIAELEAHAADCKRLVTACEYDLEELRFKYRQAEAALAERDKVIDAMEDFIDSCTYHMRDGDTVNYTGPRAEKAKP